MEQRPEQRPELALQQELFLQLTVLYGQLRVLSHQLESTANMLSETLKETEKLHSDAKRTVSGPDAEATPDEHRETT